jgi:hypothetical protein
MIIEHPAPIVTSPASTKVPNDWKKKDAATEKAVNPERDVEQATAAVLLATPKMTIRELVAEPASLSFVRDRAAPGPKMQAHRPAMVISRAVTVLIADGPHTVS